MINALRAESPNSFRPRTAKASVRSANEFAQSSVIGNSVKKTNVAMMNGSRPYRSAKYAVGMSAAVAISISIAVRRPTFVAVTPTLSMA